MNKILYFFIILIFFLAVPTNPFTKSALFSKYKINITIKQMENMKTTLT